MIDLKSFRITHGLSQQELSFLFDCPQGYISRMENNKMSVPEEYITLLKLKYGETVSNFVIDKKPSKILNLMGWKSKTDPEYEHLKIHLIEILDFIKEKTGFSIEEISQKLYRRRKIISEALSREEISPNMIEYILKNIKKLGLDPTDSILADLIESENNISKPVYNTVENFLEKKDVETHVQTTLFKNTENLIRIDTKNLSPYISLGDIVGIKQIKIEDIKSGAYYLLVFKNGKYSFDFIKLGTPEENKWNLCGQKDGLAYMEIDNSDIRSVYKITLTIRREAD